MQLIQLQQKMETNNMTTLHLRKSINPSPLRPGLPRVQSIWIIRGFLLIPLVLAWFALSPSTRAVLPAPDGGYPSNNTAEGDDALFSLTTGANNTANGFDALYSNTDGIANTATGSAALFKNTTGFNNTANGAYALELNTTGTFNTANGVGALLSNTTGYFNTANGFDALFSNTTSGGNTAEGYQALQNNTGSDNTGLGVNAGLNLTTGSQNIDIGNSGVAAESNTMRIGRAANQTRAFIAGIRGVTTANANAVPVVIDSAGQLGTMSSSKRFKKEIKPMDQTSEAIL